VFLLVVLMPARGWSRLQTEKGPAKASPWTSSGTCPRRQVGTRRAAASIAPL